MSWQENASRTGVCCTVLQFTHLPKQSYDRDVHVGLLAGDIGALFDVFKLYLGLLAGGIGALIGLFVLYRIIRLAVRQGVRDALER